MQRFMKIPTTQSIINQSNVPKTFDQSFGDCQLARLLIAADKFSYSQTGFFVYVHIIRITGMSLHLIMKGVIMKYKIICHNCTIIPKT